MAKKSTVNTKIKHIGVLTSGGDSPGMNCAIRSIVRSGIYHNLKVSGIHRGYTGLLEGEITPMEVSSVGNILQRGGTILKTSRCADFMKKNVREEAVHILRRKGIDALIVIGGDGSFNGAHLMSKENDYPVIGIPGTIDNDISGTSYTIGFNTAVETGIEAVDRIRDTAASHERTFLVEVMGRNSGTLALHVGVCTGAENILFPQEKINYEQVAADIKRGIARGKNSSIIIVAEGKAEGRSYEIAKNLKTKFKLDSRVCILGHTQRGGAPSAIDRFFASKMGDLAIHAIINKNFNTVTVYVDGKFSLSPIDKCLKKKDLVEQEYLDLARVLSI
ncbi:MAG: 6-phosphofructokinase [Bacteriovoracaceae bacterium]